MHVFFVEGTTLKAGSEVALAPADLNHACRVLRLHKDSPVIVSDGQGLAFKGIITALTPREGRVRLVAAVPPAESPLRVTLMQALVKGEKMDLIVRQAVELGAARLVPVVTGRSIPRLNAAKEAGRLERWRKIARAAAAQCRRAVIPVVEPLHSFAEVLALVGGAMTLVPWEKERHLSLGALLRQPGPGDGALLVFVGPEGGFSAAEAKLLTAAGARTVQLGPRILRAETAAAAVLGMVQAAWGDLGGDSHR